MGFETSHIHKQNLIAHARPSYESKIISREFYSDLR